MNGVEIVPFDPSLKDELVEFRRRTYETGFPESRDYLEWKYEQNPYIPGPIYYIARARPPFCPRPTIGRWIPSIATGVWRARSCVPPPRIWRDAAIPTH